MILLRCLSYPNRWYDLVPIFGRTEPELSMAFDMVIMKHLNSFEMDENIGQNKNVKGNLKENLEYWEFIGASSFILNVIKFGYRLPFWDATCMLF